MEAPQHPLSKKWVRQLNAAGKWYTDNHGGDTWREQLADDQRRAGGTSVRSRAFNIMQLLGYQPNQLRAFMNFPETQIDELAQNIVLLDKYLVQHDVDLYEFVLLDAHLPAKLTDLLAPRDHHLPRLQAADIQLIHPARNLLALYECAAALAERFTIHAERPEALKAIHTQLETIIAIPDREARRT